MASNQALTNSSYPLPICCLLEPVNRSVGTRMRVEEIENRE
jgi:hypothetical protein